jgi:high-affinity iron transporter
MLLNSVIIVLREVLEASLLISILLALSGALGISRRWIVWSLGFGLIGAIIYSFGVTVISDWFDGVGQEVVSAIMQILIYLLLLAVTFLVLQKSDVNQLSDTLTVLVMTTTVALAVVREGFEILVYIYGFSNELPQFMTILTGVVIGASIGISIGALIYYFVSSLSCRLSLMVGLSLLALVAAGMLSQAVLLLVQADWLPSQLPLWDSSGWLSETSVTGQLLYALIGYEATPGALQASFYFGGFTLLLIVVAIAIKVRRQPG